MTIKEISDLVGVSVRTLHYYDEIGVFSTTEKSEAGYRLNNEESLEILIQILFFREIGIPLKKIKDIMNCATHDKKISLLMQRKALIAKKDYIECLISSIDNILNDNAETVFIVLNRTKIMKYFKLILLMNEDINQIIY